MMYSRIFVPIDSSAPSDLALDEAIKLAQGLGSILHLCHSVDLPQYGRGNPEQLDSTALEQPRVSEGNVTLDAACARARAAGLEPESSLIKIHGDPIAGALLAQAHRCNADLIVMGTHGRTGIMHLLLGSVAEGVLRTSDLPVLLIRREDSAS